MSQTTLREDSSSSKRLVALLRPYLPRLLLVMGMLFALALVNMGMFALIAKLFNDVFPNRNWGLLWLILIGVLAIYIARNLFYFSGKYTAVSIGENVCFSLRNRLFENLQQMSLQFYKDNKPGKISSRLMNDSFVIQSFIQDELPTLLLATLQFMFIICWIYAMNWQLALASTAILPVHLAVYFRFKRPIKEASKVAQEQLAVVHGNLIEKFLGAEVVKGFTAENRESAAFVKAIDLSRRSQLVSSRFHVTQKAVADVVVGLGTILLLGFGAYQVLKTGPNAMKPGTFIQFFGYIGMLYPTVLELMSGFAKLTKASASIDRVFEMLESQGPESSGDGLEPPIRGHLKFDSVSFCYSDGAPVLKNVNLEVRPGQVCAIVGPSGAGKTTLVSLVPRLIEPDLGFIELDDIRLDQYDVRYLREAVGIAFQECFLFNSSILENLLYANPNATMKQVIDVAKKTGAHNFIMKLPQGYDTLVGEQGVSLSRGEKQRITLSRAMLKNPKILILDEATASIDIASESQIIPNILDFMRGKTTLMITHRPELLQHADIVVNLVEGRVKYLGPPEHLPELVMGATSPGVRAAPVEMPSEPNRPEAARTVRGLRLLLFLAAALVGSVSPVLAQDAPAPAPAVASGPMLANAGRFTSMAGMSDTEMVDLLDVVVSRMQAEHGYRLSDSRQDVAALPVDPELRSVRVLVRSSPQELTLLQLGFKSFRSQPPHLWTYGITIPADGQAKPADPLPMVETLVQETRKTMEAHMASLKASDLRSETIRLSYIEADRCLGILKSLGYQVIEFTSPSAAVGKSRIIAPNAAIDTKNLPVVMAVPEPETTGLVGGSTAQKGTFGLVMTPSIASDIPLNTSASPLMELIVLYNPANPEQFSQLLSRIRREIDTPARQLLIEVMVLEISETGLKKLGVEWEVESPSGQLNVLRLGRLPDFTTESGRAVRTFQAGFNNIFGEFEVKIEALLQNGEAEILSRPSVLTIDNRQASIRVGEEIPVATSVTGVTGGDTIGFQFQYIPIGILLNVRPRISFDNEQVSMQIDGIVSAVVPGQDLIIRNVRTDDELARAPRISTRRVQTYTRIANNTPIIIGGLVSNDQTKETRKVPILGDIPIIGHAFRSEVADRLKREVIIVITPYVLPEEKLAGRSMPEDEDAFDSFGNKLFRDAYRIRAEDVFDLRFLTENVQLKQMKELAEQVARRNSRLAANYPFDRFVGTHIPGERILVYRQMYEVIKRRQIENNIEINKLIFFLEDEDSQSGFEVKFLSPFMEKMGSAVSPKGEFAGFGKQALAMTFTMQQYSDQASGILSQPVPKVQLIDCADRDQWSRLLWEMNQPGEDGKERYTLLIQNQSDLVRLKRAIVVKRTVELNVAGDKSLTLENFTIGRQLLMPAVKPDKVYLVDEEVAKYFFFTEQYYPAVRQELERDIQSLRAMLRDPSVTPYLDNPADISGPIQWVPSDR